MNFKCKGIKCYYGINIIFLCEVCSICLIFVVWIFIFDFCFWFVICIGILVLFKVGDLWELLEFIGVKLWRGLDKGVLGMDGSICLLINDSDFFVWFEVDGIWLCGGFKLLSVLSK